MSRFVNAALMLFMLFLKKYIPTDGEIRRLRKENEGAPQLSKGGFFFRLVPFTR